MNRNLQHPQDKEEVKWIMKSLKLFAIILLLWVISQVVKEIDQQAQQYETKTKSK